MRNKMGLCPYNKQINCERPIGCETCNWNPTYFEEKKRKGRAEREAQMAKATKA